MTLARKIVLHSPVSDQRLLEDFVEECLRDGVSLLAIVGPDCTLLEDVIDEIIVGDGGEPGRFICTTSHPDEAVSEVIEFAQMWEYDRQDPFQEIRL